MTLKEKPPEIRRGALPRVPFFGRSDARAQIYGEATVWLQRAPRAFLREPAVGVHFECIEPVVKQDRRVVTFAQPPASGQERGLVKPCLGARRVAQTRPKLSFPPATPGAQGCLNQTTTRRRCIVTLLVNPGF